MTVGQKLRVGFLRDLAFPRLLGSGHPTVRSLPESSCLRQGNSREFGRCMETGGNRDQCPEARAA
jgi:hypothetical protein